MLNLLHMLYRRAAHRVKRMRDDHALRNELADEIAGLERAGELEGALANHGWAPPAVPYLIDRYPGALRRHDTMRRRLGISPSHFVPRTGLAALDRSRTRCLSCTSARRCEAWLESNEAGVAPFCPNRETFERLRWQSMGASIAAAR